MQAFVGRGETIARKEILPAGIGGHVQVLPVAQAGATYRLVVERKAQWLHQMQTGAGDHAGTADIARIGRNLGRTQHDVEHESPWLRTKNHHEGDSELPPISWTSGNGRFSISIDLRVKHDLESRRRAVELFDAGVGCKPAAEALSVPRETVREWQRVYRAFGSEALLSMGGKQSRYTFEQRVAAASAVVDGGMAKADAMAEFGIRSKSPLERWCRLYREGGAEALRPRPKGRPRGSRSKPRARTREQELEERCRRLEAEVAYLKKLRALVERDGL